MYFWSLLVYLELYQFSPLKTKCLELWNHRWVSLWRRWRSGTVGDNDDGNVYGLYCLGCCWPYFLLMVALGWMNLVLEGFVCSYIFGEKVWVRGGKWIARSAGVGFVTLGALALLGIMEVPTGDMTMTDVVSNNNKGTGDGNEWWSEYGNGKWKWIWIMNTMVCRWYGNKWWYAHWIQERPIP